MRYQINKKLGLQRRYKTCLGARITFWNSFVVLLSTMEMIRETGETLHIKAARFTLDLPLRRKHLQATHLQHSTGSLCNGEGNS